MTQHKASVIERYRTLSLAAGLEAACDHSLTRIKDFKEYKAALAEVADLLEEAEKVLKSLIELPDAQIQLRHLKKGIGTKTENAVWLDAEKLRARIRGGK